MKEKPKILVVEDDPDLLSATIHVVGNTGLKVLGAASGEDCLSRAAREQPALVLLNFVLPDINGVEVCRRIKSDPALADTFVVLISGQRTASDEQADGLFDGADGYIARPISNRELLARIEGMLRLQEAQRALRREKERLKAQTVELGAANVALKAEIARRERFQGLVEQVSRLWESLLKRRKLQAKLQGVTDSVVKIFDADFARIWIIKPGDRCGAGCVHADVTEGPHVCRDRKRCLHLMASSGRYTHIDGEVHRRVPFGLYKIGLVAAGDESKFITNKVTSDPRVHGHEWARELGLVSFAGYRLLSSEGQPVGVFALFSKHEISPEEDTLLDEVATTAAMIAQATQIEQKLRESELDQHALVDNTNDLFHLINPDGTLLALNRALADRLGKTVDDLTGLNIFDLFPKEAALRRKAMAEQVKESGRAQEFIDESNGRVFESRLFPQKDESGNTTQIAIFVRDITDRSKTEKALLDSQEKYRSVIEHAGVGILVIQNGHQVFFNAKVCELVDRNEEEFITHNFLSFLDPEDRSLITERISQWLASTDAGTQLVRLRILTKSGETRWIEANSVKIQWEGRPAVQAFLLDITERKQAEDLRLQNEELQTFNQAMIERESRIIELKEEVNRLAAELERQIPYEPVWNTDEAAGAPNDERGKRQ